MALKAAFTANIKHINTFIKYWPAPFCYYMNPVDKPGRQLFGNDTSAAIMSCVVLKARHGLRSCHLSHWNMFHDFWAGLCWRHYKSLSLSCKASFSGPWCDDLLTHGPPSPSAPCPVCAAADGTSCWGVLCLSLSPFLMKGTRSMADFPLVLFTSINFDKLITIHFSHFEGQSYYSRFETNGDMWWMIKLTSILESWETWNSLGSFGGINSLHVTDGKAFSCMNMWKDYSKGGTSAECTLVDKTHFTNIQNNLFEYV